MAWTNPAGIESQPYRQKLTINPAKVSGSPAHIPIRITASCVDPLLFSHARSDGLDIQVTGSDGVTLLNRDIVYYSNSGTLELRARTNYALSSSSPGEYYIYYGNGNLIENEATTYRNAVFVSPDCINNRVGTNGSGTAPDIAGPFGLKAKEFNTNNINISSPVGSIATSRSIAVFAWVYSYQSQTANAISGWNGSTARFQNHFSGNKFTASASSGPATVTTIEGGTSVNSWVNIVTSLRTETVPTRRSYIDIYKDGYYANTSNSSGLSDSVYWNTWNIGTKDNGAAYFKGRIGQVEIYKFTNFIYNHLTSDYIATRYRNETDPPGFFLLLGIEQSKPSDSITEYFGISGKIGLKGLTEVQVAKRDLSIHGKIALKGLLETTNAKKQFDVSGKIGIKGFIETRESQTLGFEIAGKLGFKGLFETSYNLNIERQMASTRTLKAKSGLSIDSRFNAKAGESVLLNKSKSSRNEVGKWAPLPLMTTSRHGAENDLRATIRSAAALTAPVSRLMTACHGRWLQRQQRVSGYEPGPAVSLPAALMTWEPHAKWTPAVIRNPNYMGIRHYGMLRALFGMGKWFPVSLLIKFGYSRFLPFNLLILDELPGTPIVSIPDLDLDNDDDLNLSTPKFKLTKKELYIMGYQASFKRLADNTPLNPISFSCSTDIGSWCWTFSFDMLESEANLVKPTPTNKWEIRMTVNGIDIDILIESAKYTTKLGKTECTVSGRSVTAWLSDPHESEISLIEPNPITAQQAVLSLLPNGWALDWNLEFDPILKDFSFTNKTPIKAINDLIDDIGGRVESALTGRKIIVNPKLPFLPWKAQQPQVDIETSLSFFESFDFDYGISNGYNAARVIGTSKDSVHFEGYITGTDGGNIAPSFVSSNITDIYAGRMKAESIIAESLFVNLGTLKYYVDEQPDGIGLLLPGMVIKLTEDGRLGVVSRVSFSGENGLATASAEVIYA